MPIRQRPNKATPCIEGDTLHLPEGSEAIPVGSAAWFCWLESAHRFAVRHGDYGSFLCRKEQRQRGKGYWSAYRRVNRRTYHVYAGRGEDLSAARLAEVGQRLAVLIAEQGRVVHVGKQRIDPPRVKSVRLGRNMLWFDLTDGRVLGAPLNWFPRLANAAPDKRAQWELIADDTGVAWPHLDEHISVRVLMNLPS